jgi:hypothetical protein
LIDGGKGDGFRKIKSSIDAIAKSYRLPTGTTNLKFDSVVITHWDLDHYKGVLDLINDDLHEQIEDIKKTHPPTKADIDNMQCRLFKYDGAGRSKPLTTFYVLYWEGNAEMDFRKLSTRPPKKKKKGLNDRPTVVEESGKAPALLLDFKTYKQMDGNKQRPKPEILGFSFTGLCNLCYKPDEMIGVNFLNNERLTSKSYKDVTSPADLVANVTWEADTPVGIFCVGSYNAVIGDKNTTFQVCCG